MLLWINFDIFAITYLMYFSLKTSFSNRACAEFFAITKGPGTSFQDRVFVEFFDNHFSFVM